MAEKKTIPVTRSSMPEFEEYIKEIQPLWESRRLTNMGSKHNLLQSELEAYLDVPNIDLVSSGHMALEIAMQALELTGEVITTPYTFASTTHAIVRSGLKPVFCDINPVDFTIDTSKIESLITEKTTAIVAVHVYGNVCNIGEIDRIAKKHHLKVIYDAAHAFGVKYRGKGIGSFGDISCFSFHATKVFNTAEGGAVCFEDRETGERIHRIKNFGIRDYDLVDEVGTNAKMNEFCAAMGLCNLRYIDFEIAKRKTITDRYFENLSDINGLRLNAVQQDVTPNYAYFPVIFDEDSFGAGRDEVFEKLSENDIFARKYFYPLTSAFDCYRGMYDPALTPVALDISQRVLALPLYSDLHLEDVDRICSIVLGCRK
ncbi:MAG TPA: DegT/DnrJ/EryC1/StrS family aminotransferase [Oscillospiraceae bacterium]|nr:DegT/DnrJ/EryC1/StrS family aminotransferase [Oscillospiraceae bacterium]HPF55249.1 DegT/DnrJ/EryC1/StrS family aminotransferase [Clostridiales bacterium]HPK36025.1 DegT/DnrJ/EryC1/StrS family aminotransferase [Oscillospiraceae bacterium]HPR76320.1 DegT/DnrJ/EryC1/StrS family aminotransferase [Oscillospiraceae bacterium]